MVYLGVFPTDPLSSSEPAHEWLHLQGASKLPCLAAGSKPARALALSEAPLPLPLPAPDDGRHSLSRLLPASRPGSANRLARDSVSPVCAWPSRSPAEVLRFCSSKNTSFSERENGRPSTGSAQLFLGLGLWCTWCVFLDQFIISRGGSSTSASIAWMRHAPWIKWISPASCPALMTTPANK